MKTDGRDQNTKGAAPGAVVPMTEEERERKTMQAQIRGMAREFEHALPGNIGLERMMRIVMTAVLKTPALAKCEPVSFMGSLLQALQLGLEVNTPLGQAYLIPRRKKDRNGNFLGWECNFQLGYQGLIDLCYRFGQYKIITAEVVHEGDDFHFSYGTNQSLEHRPEGKKGAKPTHVWALYQLENGGERFVVWTWEEAMAHGEQFSDSFNKNKPWASPWLANETAQEEMAKKSVLKALLKYAPKSVEGKIEAAAYADGRAVIADKFEDDGGNMRFSLDVQQIAPPDPEGQEMMNQINGVDRKAEKETVPVNRGGNTREPPAQQTVSPAQHGNSGDSVSRNDAPQQSGGNPARRGRALFSPDEAADLEGIEPPNFR